MYSVVRRRKLHAVNSAYMGPLTAEHLEVDIQKGSILNMLQNKINKMSCSKFFLANFSGYLIIKKTFFIFLIGTKIVIILERVTHILNKIVFTTWILYSHIIFILLQYYVQAFIL